MDEKIVGPSAKTAPEPEQPNIQDIPVYNPLDQPFTTTFDINEDGYPVDITIPSRQIKRFPQRIATHLKKHLATAILNKRGHKTVGDVQLSWQDSYNEYYKETEV